MNENNNSEDNKSYSDLMELICDHRCNNCPFSNECTHYENDKSGLIDE